jgi:hypothetical protein
LQSVIKKTFVSLQEKNILFKQKDYHVLGLPLFGPFGCYDGGGGHACAVNAMEKNISNNEKRTYQGSRRV